jgi:Fe2+ or Zn2+ uptake regulation protein
MERKSRNTKQKEASDKNIKSFDSFFTAEDLLKKVNKKDSKIGIATVYRFLGELVKHRKIFCYSCNRRLLYSLNKKSHCHYTCEKTGKIIHFDIDNLDFLKYIKDKIPGTINSIQLEIKGVCFDCK